ncbi:MAG: YhdP family protein [Burkholderiaceae bacterium]
MPSVEGAAGRLVVDEAGGRLQIGGDKGSAWSFPGLFEAPRVVLDRWSARLDWLREPAGELRVRLREVRFANADADGSVTGSIRLVDGRPVVDLAGRLQRARATSVARYLPLSVPPPVRQWVAQAVRAGDSDDVKLALAGDLHEFPFERPGAQGRFRVDVRLRGGRLQFAPGWPALERIAGRLTFERASMQAKIDDATLHGAPVAGTQLRIADFHQGVLDIQGRTTAPANRLIGLVNASPLERFVNGALREASATGNVDLALNARIPLHPNEPNEFDAALTLHDNDFLLGPGKPVLGAMRGALMIGHGGVAARGVSARLLGGPVHVDASTSTPGHVALHARGGLSLEGLRALSDNPLTRKLDGHADYEADVDIDARGVKLTLSSDLVGVTSELPPPFAKRAGVAMPLRVVSSPAPAAADGFTTSITLGDAVRMRIARRFDAKAGRALIDRAAFAMNTEPVLPESGLSVALNLPRVDFDAWGAAMASASIGQPDENLGGEFAPGFSLLPKHVSVLTDELLVGGKSLRDVVFGATRQQGIWQANVSAREVDGYFSWRDAPPGQPLGKLTARFTRLEIPPSRRQEIESIMETDRTDLPELDVTAEELVLNNHRLGRLELIAGNGSEAGRPAWKLQHLRIAHPAATLEAAGVWAQRSRRDADPATRTTALDFKLELRDSGTLLNDLGVRDAIRAGAGEIHGHLDWAGSPLAIDYPSLRGRIGIALGKGQFLKTEPGLAKLIGVLNLQSLPRRLSLDFRDIFAEGFAFDEINGDVRVDRGVAHTDDLKMNGVQARVHLRGDADLAHETQSLDVEVRPHLNAGLASLAYAAVNPVIGLGSFVAQFMLRAPLEQAFTYEYRVTGPWADPVVVEKSRPHPPAPRAEP